jgi:hypothetical protein
MLTPTCQISVYSAAFMSHDCCAAANGGCCGQAVPATRPTPCRYPRTHPFAQLAGSDNMVVFTTERYPAAQPLIVRGPGAGAEVTAAGVLGDIVTLCRRLGAPRAAGAG